MGMPESLVHTALLTIAAGAANELNTATRDHRVYTHRSLAFRNEGVEKAALYAGGHLTDTKRWACVHRVHHSTPDANLVGFVKLADYADYLSKPGANASGHPEIPDKIYGLDPAVESIDFNTAYEIGSLARDLVGGLYQPPAEYSAAAGTQILYSNALRYLYEDPKIMKRDRKNPVVFDPANPPSLDQIRFLLRDPHSPALHKRGVLGILTHNVPQYGYVENNFEDPIFRPADLQSDELGEKIRNNRGKLRLAYVGGMMLTNVLLGNKESAAKAARNAFLGAAASGGAVVILIGGGNGTNALGHAGDWDKLTWDDIKHGKVHPKMDGTYTSNSVLLSAPTLDEVGAQEAHHDHPELIAYTEETGLAAVKSAPFGKFLEFMVRHGIIFKNGDNFAGMDHRPDEPSEAVLVLQDYRAKQLALQAA